MRDIYLYDDCPVLINKLGIKEQKLLDDAEADYVSYRLRELAIHPLTGGLQLSASAANALYHISRLI